MVLIASALFGLAIGVLIELASGVRGRLIPTLCAAVIITLAVVVLIANYPGNWASGFVISLSGLAGAALASGYVWRDHPLVSEMSYWARVEFAWRNERVLREQVAEAVAARKETASGG